MKIKALSQILRKCVESQYNMIELKTSKCRACQLSGLISPLGNKAYVLGWLPIDLALRRPALYAQPLGVAGES